MKTKAMIESLILEKNYKMNRSDALKQGGLLAKNHHKMRTQVFRYLSFSKLTERQSARHLVLSILCSCHRLRD